MSLLFDPFPVGARLSKNRFLRSAAYEALAEPDGRVTAELLRLYRRLGEGGVGVVITGFMWVSAEGRCVPRGTGIDRDELLPGLSRLATTIKQAGALAIFQIFHAGAQTPSSLIGQMPVGPSSSHPDHTFGETPLALAQDEIERIVAAFAAAAARAQEAGADGVQIHGAHGYLVSQFLSPFFNDRRDAYGHSEEGRYRFLGEILRAVRRVVDDHFLVTVKMNVDDGTPAPGITPELAARYASWMVADGVDCVEISAGSTTWAPLMVCRGKVDLDDFVHGLAEPERSVRMKQLLATPRPPFEEAHNTAVSGTVKAALGTVPLAVVGGMRTLARMEECVAEGKADLLSLCRPLVREPGLIRSFQDRSAASARCISCSRCLAGAIQDLPLRCYARGFRA